MQLQRWQQLSLPLQQLPRRIFQVGSILGTAGIFLERRCHSRHRHRCNIWLVVLDSLHCFQMHPPPLLRKEALLPHPLSYHTLLLPLPVNDHMQPQPFPAARRTHCSSAGAARRQSRCADMCPSRRMIPQEQKEWQQQLEIRDRACQR
jgi:hypothetical protein